MKTTVEVSHSGKLYLVCTVENDVTCSTSLEKLQKAFERVHINAKTVRSGNDLVIIVHLENTSAALDVFETLKSAVCAILSATHIFQKAEMEYQEKLSALAKDLYAASKSASSPKKKDDSEGQ